MYAFIVIALSIFVDRILVNVGFLLNFFFNAAEALKNLVMPFIYGFSIAYLISPAVSFFERVYFGKIRFFKKHPRANRNLSIALTYFIFIGCIVWLLLYLIPEMSLSILNFFTALPENFARFERDLYEYFDSLTFINSADVITFMNAILQPIVDSAKNVPKIVSKFLDGTVPALLTGTFSLASTLLKLLLGVFIGFYMLAEKEGFIAGMKKILYAFFNVQSTDQFLHKASRVNNLFKNFIVGKTVDSIIIAIICLCGVTLLKMPYAGLISVIIGITNMIPYFGPFIGAVPSILIVLLTEPSKAWIIALFILALQQFDGIILGPKILGVSTGMSAIWIILSITIGGAIMGPAGMFIGVPIFASVKLFFSEYVDKKYSEKFPKK